MRTWISLYGGRLLAASNLQERDCFRHIIALPTLWLRLEDRVEHGLTIYDLTETRSYPFTFDGLYNATTADD